MVFNVKKMRLFNTKITLIALVIVYLFFGSNHFSYTVSASDYDVGFNQLKKSFAEYSYNNRYGNNLSIWSSASYDNRFFNSPEEFLEYVNISNNPSKPATLNITDEYIMPVAQTIQQNDKENKMVEEKLTNLTSKPRILFTPERIFERTYVDSVTNQHNVGLGFKSASTFKVPFVNNTTELSLNYNYQNSGTQQESHRVQIKVPSQEIEVDPDETIIVTYFLQEGVATGNLDFMATMEGQTFNGMGINQFYHYLMPINAQNVGEWMFTKQPSDNWSYKNNLAVNYKAGEGNFSSSYYSSSYLVVRRAGKFHDRETVKVIPIIAEVNEL